MQRCVTVAFATALTLWASSASAHAQLGDGSIGTVQVGAAPVEVSATTEPGASATVDAPAASLGDQTASSSVGTVQVQTPALGGEAQVQPSAEGSAVSPDSSFAVQTSPGEPRPQEANESVGTAQVGSSGSQEATGSAGTAQVAIPSVEAGGSFEGPLRPDMPDGLVAPESQVGLATGSGGGMQRAESSAGTLQVGSGEQTASNSAGTAQLGLPSGEASAAAGGSEPASAEGSAATTSSAGGQRADASAGTLQVGSGDQAAVDSVGSGQVAVPDARVGVGEGAAEAGATPTGGSQSATGSAGTLQLGGGARLSRTLASTASTPARPAEATSTPATPLAPGSPASGTEAGEAVPVSGTLGENEPVARVAVAVGRLPFTGSNLIALVLLGLTLLGCGFVLRRRSGFDPA